MKRKYYLRGLGIGILITAIVFIVAGPSKMTDDEIIKRAEELGYKKVSEENSSINLKDLMEAETPAPSEQPQNTEVPSKIPESTSVPEVTETPVPTATEIPQVPTETPVPTPTPIPTPTIAPTPTVTPTPTAEPLPVITAAPEEGRMVQIVVDRGDSTIKVCNKIAQAGIITDANELINYFIINNLTNSINVGTYTLSSDMTFAEIAKILTEIE